MPRRRAQVFCGNLAFEADEGVVREAFAAAGEVRRPPPTDIFGRRWWRACCTTLYAEVVWNW